MHFPASTASVALWSSLQLNKKQRYVTRQHQVPLISLSKEICRIKFFST